MLWFQNSFFCDEPPSVLVCLIGAYKLYTHNYFFFFFCHTTGAGSNPSTEIFFFSSHSGNKTKPHTVWEWDIKACMPCRQTRRWETLASSLPNGVFKLIELLLLLTGHSWSHLPRQRYYHVQTQPHLLSTCVWGFHCVYITLVLIAAMSNASDCSVTHCCLISSTECLTSCWLLVIMALQKQMGTVYPWIDTTFE